MTYENIQTLRFKVIFFEYTDERGTLCRRPEIILVDSETGVPLACTNIMIAWDQNKNKIVRLYASEDNVAYTICQLLNYILIDNYDYYQITQISQITKAMIQDWLNDYSTNPCEQTKEYPRKETIDAKRQIVCTFGELLAEHVSGSALHPGDLMVVASDIAGKHHRYTYFVNYTLVTVDQERSGVLRRLQRDMPIAIFNKLIATARMYDPEMELVILLGMLGGMREGEICNVRRRDSLYGPGILFEQELGHCASIAIDLSQHWPMRDDGVAVGRIKVRREVIIYPDFCQRIYDAYRRHLEMIRDKPTDASKPMFLNKNQSADGKYHAMTVEGLRYRIKQLFYTLLPELEYDPDPDLRLFYASMQLKNRTWDAHAMRHWFSVFMVVLGVSAQELKSLRGDRSMMSAITYLEHKGEIVKRYRAAVEKLGEHIIEDKKNT